VEGDVIVPQERHSSSFFFKFRQSIIGKTECWFSSIQTIRTLLQRSDNIMAKRQFVLFYNGIKLFQLERTLQCTKVKQNSRFIGHVFLLVLSYSNGEKILFFTSLPSIIVHSVIVHSNHFRNFRVSSGWTPSGRPARKTAKIPEVIKVNNYRDFSPLGMHISHVPSCFCPAVDFFWSRLGIREGKI
jgi:hypothetical protein